MHTFLGLFSNNVYTILCKPGGSEVLWYVHRTLNTLVHGLIRIISN